jgi:hypothetical protein
MQLLHSKWAAIVLASSLVVPGVALAQQPGAPDRTKAQHTADHSITIHNKGMLNSYTKFSCSNKGCQFAGENTVAEPAPLPSGNSSTTVHQSVNGQVGPGQQPATVTVPATPTPTTKGQSGPGM